MILALYRDDTYNLFLLLHILASIVALVPSVSHSVLFALEAKRPDGDVVALAGRTSAATRIYLIALIIAGLLGFGLISMSDKVIEWGDTWVWLSIVVWLGVNGVFHALVVPAEKELAGGDRSALAKVRQYGMISGGLLLILVYLMVMKPGA